MQIHVSERSLRRLATKSHVRGKNAYFDARPEEAEWLLLQALYKAESFGEKDMRLVLSLTDLGGLFVLRNKFPEAEQQFARAVKIAPGVLGRNDLRCLKRKYEALRKRIPRHSMPFTIKWL